MVCVWKSAVAGSFPANAVDTTTTLLHTVNSDGKDLIHSQLAAHRLKQLGCKINFNIRITSFYKSSPWGKCCAQAAVCILFEFELLVDFTRVGATLGITAVLQVTKNQKSSYEVLLRIRSCIEWTHQEPQIAVSAILLFQASCFVNKLTTFAI